MNCSPFARIYSSSSFLIPWERNATTPSLMAKHVLDRLDAFLSECLDHLGIMKKGTQSVYRLSPPFGFPGDHGDRPVDPETETYMSCLDYVYHDSLTNACCTCFRSSPTTSSMLLPVVST